jgi:hypothetical protein
MHPIMADRIPSNAFGSTEVVEWSHVDKSKGPVTRRFLIGALRWHSMSLVRLSRNSSTREIKLFRGRLVR